MSTPFSGRCDFCRHPASLGTRYHSPRVEHTFYSCGRSLCQEFVDIGIQRLDQLTPPALLAGRSVSCFALDIHSGVPE
ncbi:hypothetical protein [Craterilacuibacter sinensis]|uniref:Uncharacterized protein n=1 Tax=Craterilacuibacter sinensis TaxID=2686017 RepID=A0A845BUH4_9NEIS|nr:hypothetical protein [Craterilacuibacter sinensis]MXR38261.1 hypothetical protein [Craterilacuibacter sinensis]